MKNLSKKKLHNLIQILMSLNQEKKLLRDLKLMTLNQIWLLYQVTLYQVKFTLKKPAKIWD